MSQNIGQTELQEKTRRLVDGPLKHIRVVALAAALMPLASLAPAAAQCVPTPSNSCTPTVVGPGTGTPGYWKNHAGAWPVESITVGGDTYTKAQAIALLGSSGKDKSITMFSSLVPAMLNEMIGNDISCVASAMATADAWLATHGPAGSNVAGDSAAWVIGEPLHMEMDNYNNGLLPCAAHRL
jgi:hypothetical protein